MNRASSVLLVVVLAGSIYTANAQGQSLLGSLMQLDSLVSVTSNDECAEDTLFYRYVLADQSDTAVIEANAGIAGWMSTFGYDSFGELVAAYPSFANHGLGFVVNGSLSVGADTSDVPPDTFFGYTTIMLESKEPSIRFADDSLTSWLFGTNGSAIDGFQLQDLCAQSRPFLIEPSSDGQPVFVSSDSLLNVGGVELESVTQTSAIPNGGENGALVYWNGDVWVTVSAGANNQSLTMCNGIPTWGPCPTAAMVPASLLNTGATYSESTTTLECSLEVGVEHIGLLSDQGFYVHQDIDMLQDPGSKKSASYAGEGTFELSEDASPFSGTVFVQAYAENAAGVVFGDTLQVWVESNGYAACGDVYTYHGVAYPTVEINGDCWFASNLRSRYDAYGRTLDEVTNAADVESSIAVLALYFDSATYYNDYGWMYNFKAVEAEKNGEISMCPIGWGLPTSNQWYGLDTNYVAGNHFLDLPTLQSQPNLPQFSGTCIDCNNSTGLNVNHGQYYTGSAGFNADGFNYNTGFWSRGIIPSNYFSNFQNNYTQVSLNLPVDIVLFTLRHVPSYSTTIQPQTAAYIRCVEQ